MVLAVSETVVRQETPDGGNSVTASPKESGNLSHELNTVG